MAAAYHCGAITEGSLFDSMGTAEALLRTFKGSISKDAVAELAAANVGLSCSVLADHYTLLGALPTGLTLERICSLLGVVSQEEKINLGTAAQAVESNISSINVTNNYHGLSINNLDDAGSPATLFRATVEHLAEESATIVSLMEKYTGKAKSVTIAGGWINNPVIAAAKTKQFGSYKVSDTP